MCIIENNVCIDGNKDEEVNKDYAREILELTAEVTSPPIMLIQSPNDIPEAHAEAIVDDGIAGCSAHLYIPLQEDFICMLIAGAHENPSSSSIEQSHHTQQGENATRQSTNQDASGDGSDNDDDRKQQHVSRKKDPPATGDAGVVSSQRSILFLYRRGVDPPPQQDNNLTPIPTRKPVEDPPVEDPPTVDNMESDACPKRFEDLSREQQISKCDDDSHERLQTLKEDENQKRIDNIKNHESQEPLQSSKRCKKDEKKRNGEGHGGFEDGLHDSYCRNVSSGSYMKIQYSDDGRFCHIPVPTRRVTYSTPGAVSVRGANARTVNDPCDLDDDPPDNLPDGDILTRTSKSVTALCAPVVAELVNETDQETIETLRRDLESLQRQYSQLYQREHASSTRISRVLSGFIKRVKKDRVEL